MQRVAGWLVRAMVGVVFAGAVARTFLFGAGETSAVHLIAMIPLLVLQLVVLERRGRSRWTLVALIICTMAPILVFGSSWDGIPGFLTAAFLLIVPGPDSWVLAVGFALGQGALVRAYGYSTQDAVLWSLTAAREGLILFGLATLKDLVEAVHRTRAELARVALAKDRLRAMETIQTRLVERLSAFLLKGELVRVLIPCDAGRAAGEAGKLSAMARTSSREIRTLVRSYRSLPADVPSPGDSLQGLIKIGPRLAFGLVMVSAGSLVAEYVTMLTIWDTPPLGTTVLMLGAVIVCLIPLKWRAGLLTLGLMAWLVYLLLTLAPTASDNLALLIGAMWVGIGNYGLVWLAVLARQLYGSREELARSVVALEHQRVAQDLHDLLGITLSAISLKTALVQRLVADRPDEARAHLRYAIEATRKALREATVVTGTFPDLSLELETREALDILNAAGIKTQARVSSGPFAPATETALSTVLREGVTNVLRHSTARWCDITSTLEGGLVRLHMINDGAHPAAAPGDGEGGIGNLTDRLAALGGSLKTEIDHGDRFHLIAEVPSS
ncbi:histidine kinase [Streptosporangium sp. CA-135522]|uniref:sensor histidine kinase n=1 Tax=Streptosporangium sp. CA-135522 TaxID=3240072 RepID=UPI003D91500F